jgi:DNA-binding MarR family transcriptional regulator
MTRIVDGLIAGGLAERRPHPSGRRAVTIAATARGETLTRAAQQRRIQAIGAALASLPAEQRGRLVSAAGLLNQVAAGVRSQEAGS